MDNNSRILEIDKRLKQIKEIKSGSEKSSISSKEERIKQIDERLSQIKEQKSSGKYSDFSPLLEARGVAKTLGSIADIGRETFPTTSNVQKNTIKGIIQNLEGVEGREKEIESLKKDLINIEKEEGNSIKDKFVKNIDEFSGNSGEPEGTIGQFRQKVGEFLPSLSVAGTKASVPIAAVSQTLRELGLDESYSDLIAAIGAPNFKAISQLPGKVLKKLGDYAATIGNKEYRRAGNVEKAATFLQEKVGEKNIPEVVGKLSASETPFKGNIKVGESGLNEGEVAYRPLTADVADNVGLSQYHRAKAENIPDVGQRRITNEEVLNREIDKLASKSASPQISQEFAAAERKGYQEGLESENRIANFNKEYAASKFENTSKIDEAGKETQDYLSKRVSGIEKEAQDKAAPIYESAKTKNLEGTPKGAFDYIDEQIRDNSRASPVHRDMKKAKIAIENASIDSGEEKKKIIDAIKKQYKEDPGMRDIALKEIGDVPRVTYNAGRLEKAKREISGILESVPYQEKDRRRVLTELIKKLDKDMEEIPEIFEARKIYREVMEPANFITENPILGKILNKDSGFTRPFTVTHSEIPARVISGSKSIEGAKALMSDSAGMGTKEHKKMLETLKSYINSDILSNFVETSGKVNPAKFESWKKSNPGAFILDPSLNTKLKDLKNAQIHVDRTITQNKELLDNFYKKSMSELLGPKFEGVNPDKIASRILNSTNSESVMEEVVELLSKDKTGNSMEGLKRGLIDDLNRKFKSDKFTFATFNSYLEKNRKSLSKVFNSDQMEVLEKSKDMLKKQAVMERAGKGTNSDTSAKIMENIAEKGGTKASKALFGVGPSSMIKGTFDYVKNIGESGKIQYLEKALLSPKMAKFLLTKDVKTKKNFFDSINNKEDFGRWLRDSEGFFESIGDSGKEISKNFAITSQSIGKALINNDEK
jgi:hypothetical protein